MEFRPLTYSERYFLFFYFFTLHQFLQVRIEGKLTRIIAPLMMLLMLDRVWNVIHLTVCTFLWPV